MTKPFYREDLILLNYCWLYKSGCITDKVFLKGIDKLQHSFNVMRKG